MKKNLRELSILLFLPIYLVLSIMRPGLAALDMSLLPLTHGFDVRARLSVAPRLPFGSSGSSIFVHPFSDECLGWQRNQAEQSGQQVDTGGSDDHLQRPPAPTAMPTVHVACREFHAHRRVSKVSELSLIEAQPAQTRRSPMRTAVISPRDEHPDGQYGATSEERTKRTR